MKVDRNDLSTMGLCSSDEEIAMPAPKDCEYPELEENVQKLYKNRTRWATLPVKEKLDLLNEIHTLMMTADHDEWAADSLSAMGYPPRQAIQEGSGPEMMLAVEMLMNTRIMTRDIEGDSHHPTEICDPEPTEPPVAL